MFSGKNKRHKNTFLMDSLSKVKILFPDELNFHWQPLTEALRLNSGILVDVSNLTVMETWPA